MALKYNKLSISSILIYYIIFGVLWIIFSDNVVVYIASDSINLNTYQSYKDWSFILITGAFLYISLKIHERSFNLSTKK
jgi:hypothetical protein